MHGYAWHLVFLHFILPIALTIFGVFQDVVADLDMVVIVDAYSESMQCYTVLFTCVQG